MSCERTERQGRASGLYDEQLQRQMQEKILFRTMAAARANPAKEAAELHAR